MQFLHLRFLDMCRHKLHLDEPSSRKPVLYNSFVLSPCRGLRFPLVLGPKKPFAASLRAAGRGNTTSLMFLPCHLSLPLPFSRFPFGVFRSSWEGGLGPWNSRRSWLKSCQFGMLTIASALFRKVSLFGTGDAQQHLSRLTSIGGRHQV